MTDPPTPAPTSPLEEAPPLLAAWIMRLRDGVQFLRRPSRDGSGTPEFVIEDRTRDKFFRIGQREHAVLSRITGTASLETVLAEARKADPALDLTEEQVLDIGRWLLTTGLGHLAAHPTHGEAERAEAVRMRSRLGWLNPVSMKFKLGNPDRFLDALLPVCQWLLGWTGALLGVLIVVVGAISLITDRDRFTADMQGILGPDRRWVTLGVWLGLKGIHEVAHGLTCKKYGGHVREWGALFILFAPLGAWVNVTSSWKFPSRWQRIHVAAAGMLCEIVLAGLAAIAWSHCEPGVLRFTLHSVVVSASVVTILFNLNPLMKFDGYFILCEWLQFPNLAGHAQQAVSRQWQRVLLGSRRPAPQQGLSRWLLLTSYGWATMYWRLLTGAGIIIASSVLLHGFGLVLAVSGVFLGYVWPLLRTLQTVVRSDLPGRPHPVRALAGVAVAAGLIAALFTVIPWPGQLLAHGVVDYSQPVPIRAQTSGFVERVEVLAGDTVQPGQSLFVLRNPELPSEVTIHQSQLAEAQHRSRYFLAESAMAAFHSEEQRIAAVRDRVLESEERLAGLQIVAPQGGRIVGRDLEHLQGQWVERGTLLCELVQDDAKEILYAVPQADVQSRIDSPRSFARLLTTGTTPREMSVPLEGFMPSAEWEPPHPALSGHLGGPLSVHPVTDGTSQGPQWKLLEPHLVGHVNLSPEQAANLRSGERVTLALTGRSEPFGHHVWNSVSDWLHEKVKTAWQLSASQ
jgi:putative peptide zinc metalloprotease protein